MAASLLRQRDCQSTSINGRIGRNSAQKKKKKNELISRKPPDLSIDSGRRHTLQLLNESMSLFSCCRHLLFIRAELTGGIRSIRFSSCRVKRGEVETDLVLIGGWWALFHFAPLQPARPMWEKIDGQRWRWQRIASILPSYAQSAAIVAVVSRQRASYFSFDTRSASHFIVSLPIRLLVFPSAPASGRHGNGPKRRRWRMHCRFIA